ncbi:MAG TPA: PIN domain-containing protein [Gemmatimonadales bacterium]|nr:PIN domain-containing protein [Gemmatimonadales bacterium]
MVPPRIVLDTNVLVAALRSSRGASHRLLRQLGTGVFEHVISVPLVLEYEDALKRPASGIPLSATDIDAVLDYICASGRRQPIHFLWRPVLPDAHDDLVLEAAVNGECDAIVTFNTRDFRGADRFGLAVLTPAALAAALTATGGAP